MSGVFVDTGSNVVLDVVLTRKGREAFAAGQLPTFYAFFDDGVDYSLWDPAAANPGYLIEETPLLEPSTDDAVHPQHRLISANIPNLAYLPKVLFAQSSLSFEELAGTGQSVTSFVHYSQNGLVVPAALVDKYFVVEVDSRIVSVLAGAQGATLLSVVPGGIARYLLPADRGASKSGGGVANFSILDNPLSDLDWQMYGSKGGTLALGSRVLSTSVRVRGVQSGLQGVLQVTITEKSGAHSA